jgi:uncharacterized protein YxjI
MDVQRLQAQHQLIVRQRVRLMVNQYEVRATGPDGSEGELVAFAQQKRMAFREQVTLYTDDTKREAVLGFKARQVMDLGATYDITDAGGTSIGSFRKDFKQSLLRSTWHVEQPGVGVLTGQETNLAVALLRRFVDSLSWLPYHFDFVLNGQPAFSVVETWGRRVVIAMAVGLDALQGR